MDLEQRRAPLEWSELLLLRPARRAGGSSGKFSHISVVLASLTWTECDTELLNKRLHGPVSKWRRAGGSPVVVTVRKRAMTIL